MDFAFTEEQEELRAMARQFLCDHSDGEQVRTAMETEHGFDAETWKRIGSELGWPAVRVPEAQGGLGLGPVELTALLEPCGEALLCAPLFSGVALAVPVLLLAESAAQEAHLPGIASGETIATLAHAEETGRWDADGVAVTCRREGDAWVLDGAKHQVLDAGAADLALVSARAPGTRGDEGVSLFAVPLPCPGATPEALPTMDRTRRLGRLVLDGARLPDAARIAPEGRAAPLLARALDHAAVALAAEQVGGAQRCLDLAVAHAKERVQFGRPIGSFQAVKHICADMMVGVESARSAAYAAACVAAEGAEGLPETAALAKALASEAYFHCAAQALQVHGGVGFTWEYDVHLHLKRARSMRSFLGEPAWHRERIARKILA